MSRTIAAGRQAVADRMPNGEIERMEILNGAADFLRAYVGRPLIYTTRFSR